MELNYVWVKQWRDLPLTLLRSPPPHAHMLLVVESSNMWANISLPHIMMFTMPSPPIVRLDKRNYWESYKKWWYWGSASREEMTSKFNRITLFVIEESIRWCGALPCKWNLMTFSIQFDEVVIPQKYISITICILLLSDLFFYHFKVQ